MDRKNSLFRAKILNQYLKSHFPNSLKYQNCKIGRTSWFFNPISKNGKKKGLLFGSEGVIDGLVLTNSQVFLIQLSLNSDVRALKHLIKSEILFRLTPRFRNYWYLPITKIFLTKNVNYLLLGLATKYKVKVDFFDKSNLNPFVRNWNTRD